MFYIVGFYAVIMITAVIFYPGTNRKEMRRVRCIEKNERELLKPRENIEIHEENHEEK